MQGKGGSRGACLRLALLPLRATTTTQDKQVTVGPYKQLFQSLMLDHTNDMVTRRTSQ